ncbi:hypothetical protein R6Z07F_011167 [Ovis aries]
MGAHQYIQELWRKQQSGVMRFLLRVRCWQYRQLSALPRAPRPTQPDKARRLGYKAKQVYVICRIHVHRGGRKRPFPKGATYGKPVHHGVKQLKFAPSLQSVAEERAGRHFLQSSWRNFSFTFSTQNHLIFAQLDPLGHIQTTRLIPPKMSMSHSIQRRRTRVRLLFTSRLRSSPPHPLFRHCLLTHSSVGLEGEGTGAEPLGGAGTVSPARGVLKPGGWCSRTGSAAEMPWGPLQAPPQPRPVAQCTQAASPPNTPDLAHPEGQ